MKNFNYNADFSPFLKIEKLKNANRWAITDIHGCFETFNELLNKINFSKNDQLFLLGDYINRGSKSKEVVDKIIELLDNQYFVYPIRGNHEELLRNSKPQFYEDGMLRNPYTRRQKVFYDENFQMLPQYFQFFSKLPYFVETDDFYFAHAGFNFLRNNPLEYFDEMIWFREREYRVEKFNEKFVIQGHNVESLEFIKNCVAEKMGNFSIDNGCFARRNPELGNLLALNLDSFELIIQKNID